MPRSWWCQGLALALVWAPSPSDGQASAPPPELCALLSPATASGELPCGGSLTERGPQAEKARFGDSAAARGDVCGRALLESLLLMPRTAAALGSSSSSCLTADALLVAAYRFPDLDSALWRGALSDATLALQEQTAQAGVDSAAATVMAAGATTVGGVGSAAGSETAATSAATESSVMAAFVGCAQCAFVHQLLASQAGHHTEKGAHLARAVAAAEAFDDAVLAFKAAHGYHRPPFTDAAPTGDPASASWAWAGSEWSASAAAAKNYAFFLEHRDLPQEADAVLARALDRLSVQRERPNSRIDNGKDGQDKNHQEDDSPHASNSAVGSVVSGLALQRAMLCPPHFSSLAAAADAHAQLAAKLDHFLAHALARDQRRRRTAASKRAAAATPSKHPSNVSDNACWSRDVGFSASPLRLLGALPLAWPYLGYPMRPLHERLCLGLRLLAGPTLTAAAPHLRPLLPPPPFANATAAAPAAAAAVAAAGLTSTTPPEPLAQPSAPHTEPIRAIVRRRVKLGVFGESQGNTSPGALAGGWLARLPTSEFELIWFEPEGLATAFAAVMRARADATVVLSERPTRRRGAATTAGTAAAWSAARAEWAARNGGDDDVAPVSAADPLAVARAVVAAQRCDVLLYLALGLTPMTFLLAQARLAPVQVTFGHGHPVTSGARDAVDYFVSSALFEVTPYDDDDDARGRMVSSWQEPSLRESSFGGYTEQLVLFDTLTAALPPVHPDNPPDAAWAAAERAAMPPAAPRLSRRVLLEHLGVPDLFSRRAGPLSGLPATPTEGRTGHGEAGAADESGSLDDDDPEGAHVFACLQHSKKLHPAFDTALARLLAADPRAVVLLLDGSRAHLPRWATTLLGAPPAESNAATAGSPLARLRFLPRVPHAALLALLRVCDAFLDPWPWGAGVTSAEAFAACVPVVTWPSAQTVLPLALGQYRHLGLAGAYDDVPRGDSGLGLVARNATHYAHLAARLGLDPLFRAHASTRLCARKSRLAGPWPVVDEWAAFLRTAARPHLRD